MNRHHVSQTIKDSAGEIWTGITALIEVVLLSILWLGIAMADVLTWCWREGKAIIQDAMEDTKSRESRKRKG